MLRLIVVDFGCPNVSKICKKLSEYAVISRTSPQNIHKSMDLVDGIILSGGPHSVNDVNHPTIGESLISGKIPVLGICYGSQLIARMNKGLILSKIDLTDEVRSVFHKADDLPQSKIYRNLPSELRLHFRHRDQIVSLSEDYRVTAKHNHVIESFEHLSHPIYGVQYHPESELSEDGLIIFKNFLQICYKFRSFTDFSSSDNKIVLK